MAWTCAFLLNLMPIDSTSAAVMGVLTAVIFLSNFLGLGIAAVNHHSFPPFRAKQLIPLAVSLIASCFFVGASFQFIVADISLPFWSNCAFWLILSQVTFGVSLYISVLIYRMFNLYWMLILFRTEKTMVFWGTVGLSWLPSAILGMLPFCRPGQFISTVPEYRQVEGLTCHWIDMNYLWTLYASILGPAVVLYTLTWRISGTVKSFSEYQESKLAMMFSLLAICTNAGIVMGGLSHLYASKWVLWGINIMASNMLLWAVLFKPVVGFLFYREEFLEQWKRNLRPREVSELSEVELTDMKSKQKPQNRDLRTARPKKSTTANYNDV
ncbi:hypothetical protein HDU91_006700 [Kappamyces sp. JEL0680]|nr:hypothetical protein HDU91_006700 [Kappamyces sp. JEL0680]